MSRKFKINIEVHYNEEHPVHDDQEEQLMANVRACVELGFLNNGMDSVVESWSCIVEEDQSAEQD